MNSLSESTEIVHINQSQTSQNLGGNGNKKARTNKSHSKSKLNTTSRKRRRDEQLPDNVERVGTSELLSHNVSIEVIDVEEVKEKPVVDLTDETRNDVFVDLTCLPDVKLAHRRQTVIRWPAASARSNSTELKKNSNEIVFVPNESESNQSSVDNDLLTCAICMDDFSQIKKAKRQLTSTTCGHVFCEPCITSSLRSQAKCPTCRKRLTKRSLHPLFL